MSITNMIAKLNFCSTEKFDKNHSRHPNFSKTFY